MKRFSEQFNKQASHIRLQSSERSDLRERLVAYMEYHPLSAEAKAAMSSESFAGERFKTIRIDLPLISRFIGAFVVLTLIVIPIFAENTIPGDILYPVKVKFNEEVRSSLTFSPYQKVEWETVRLERRISEAQLLANAGLLTPEVEAQVAEAVKGHSDAAQKEIENIGTTDMAEAAIAKVALNSALEVQTEVLANQLAKNTENNATSTIGHSVSAIAAIIGEAKTNTDSKVDAASLPPEKLLAYLESETTRAYEYLDSVASVASVSERDDIRRRMKDVNTKIDLAVDEERQVTDSKLLLTAISDIRKLISFMTNIDVRANVSVEDLVPMVLTDEEHQKSVIEKSTKLNELDLLIEGRLENMPVAVKEKIVLSLLRVNELRANASTSIEGKDYLSAELNLNEALTIMLDLNNNTLGYQDVIEAETNVDDVKATTSAASEDKSSSTVMNNVTTG